MAKALESDSDDALSVTENEALHNENMAITSDSLNTGDYVLVTVHGKKSTKHFVALVTSVFADENACDVDFLTRQGNNFSVPDTKDSATVDISDVYLVLPPPAVCGGTNRTAKCMSFAVDLNQYFK